MSCSSDVLCLFPDHPYRSKHHSMLLRMFPPLHGSNPGFFQCLPRTDLIRASCTATVQHNSIILSSGQVKASFFSPRSTDASILQKCTQMQHCLQPPYFSLYTAASALFSSLPSCLEHQNRCRHRCIQRLCFPAHRNPDQTVCTF